MGAGTGGVIINSTYTSAGPWKAQAVYNSYIRTLQDKQNSMTHYNCHYVSKDSTSIIDATYPGSNISEDAACFDPPTWRQRKDSVLIDAGVKALYDDNFPANWMALATETDAYGQSRVIGSTIDVGACEYGGMPSDAREVLSSHSDFEVSNLSNGAYATSAGVVLPAAGELAYVWSLASGDVTSNEFSVVASVGAGVTLLAYLDDAETPFWTLSGSEDVQTCFYLAGKHSFRLVSQGGTSTVHSVGTDVKTPYFVKPTGDDTADGKTFATARKTLKGAMEIPGLVAGDIVYAAPGVYAEGEMWELYNSNRVVVATDVGLVGYAGAGETVIEGLQTEEEHGCGDTAVRCACVKAGGWIRGFTLCNGATATNAQGKVSEYISGGNVFTENGAAVVDCVITNGRAFYRGGGAASIYHPGGTYIRCRFSNNDCVNGTGRGALNGNYCGCVFDGYGGCVYTSHGIVLNCTFVGSSNVRGNGVAYVYNSIVENSDGGNDEYYRCLLGSSALLDSSKDFDGTLLGQANLAAKLDADYRPLKDTNLVDFGDANHYLTNFPAAFMRFADRDFADGQRVYNGAIDAGAGEYDWRGDFAKELARKGVAIPAADAGVTTNVLAGLDLPADERATVRYLPVADGDCSLTLTGNATVTLDGEVLTPADGVYSFAAEAGKSYDLVVVAISDVTIKSAGVPKRGMVLLLR